MGFRIFSVKMVAASATVLLSSAVALHFATPAVTKFFTGSGPRSVYECVWGWLTPPYLYLLINGIIISIAATSRFQKPIPESSTALSAAPPDMDTTTHHISKLAEDGPNNLHHSEFLAPEINAAAVDDEMGFVISRASCSPSPPPPTSRTPPVSSRPARRRSTKPSPEAGKPLGVSRSKKHDTLESTWKTITDGRPVPLARHLKKSDTWETHPPAATAAPFPSTPAILKSETFAAAGSVPAADDPGQFFPSAESSPPASAGKLRRQTSAVKLRREPSLGQDDLNRRVEAFIKKFNEEMRLQRQNSVQQYLDMINRSNGH